VGDINFDDINLEKSYGPWKAYKQSKLANILFTNELACRLASKSKKEIGQIIDEQFNLI
jgi:NAD(P)-dependent dehydrogenase (short-subunit alcohol dehydrogenase family)